MTITSKPSGATEITSALRTGQTLTIRRDGEVKQFHFVIGEVGIHVHDSELITALRDQGLYVTTLREAEKALQELTEEQATKLAAIEAAVCNHENSDDEECDDLTDKIKSILHPAPPYTFPSKPGAVVWAQHKRSGQKYHFFTQEGEEAANLWYSQRGGSYTEAELRANWTDFKTITEGIDD